MNKVKIKTHKVKVKKVDDALVRVDLTEEEKAESKRDESFDERSLGKQTKLLGLTTEVAEENRVNEKAMVMAMEEGEERLMEIKTIVE